jgi:hypothetical protein
VNREGAAHVETGVGVPRVVPFTNARWRAVRYNPLPILRAWIWFVTWAGGVGGKGILLLTGVKVSGAVHWIERDACGRTRLL